MQIFYIISTFCIKINANSNIGSEGVKSLTDGIKILNNLKNLNLEICYNNELSSLSGSYLNEMIKNFYKLINLKMHIGANNNLKYDGINAIIKAMQE